MILFLVTFGTYWSRMRGLILFSINWIEKTLIIRAEEASNFSWSKDEYLPTYSITTSAVIHLLDSTTHKIQPHISLIMYNYQSYQHKHCSRVQDSFTFVYKLQEGFKQKRLLTFFEKRFCFGSCVKVLDPNHYRSMIRRDNSLDDWQICELENIKGSISGFCT